MAKQHYPGLEEQQLLWQTHVETKNCPHCGHHKFYIRRLIANTHHEAHWKFTCNSCKGFWRQPLEINTFEQA